MKVKEVNKDDQILSQYKYIKELSMLKFEMEEKREQSLIQHSSQMQTAFSFVTAAIFMAVAICIEYRGELPLGFFLVAVSIIVAILLASLVLASLAQWRYKTNTVPDISVIKDDVLKNEEWEKMTVEYNQMNQYVELMATVQEEKARLNDIRVNLIIASMICFYCAIAIIVIFYGIGLLLLF